MKTRVLTFPKDPPNSAADYELLEKIGENELAEVYAARQVSPERMVAVKRLKGLS